MSVRERPLPLALLAALPTRGRAQRAAPSRPTQANKAAAPSLTHSFGYREHTAATSYLPPCGGDGRQARGGLISRSSRVLAHSAQEAIHAPRS